MSEGALEVISEYRDYFFSEEGTYLRMYEAARVPSLLPKYSIDYIVHKEVVSIFLWMDSGIFCLT